MLLDSAPPRVRTVAVDGQPDVEVELESYATFTSTDLLPIESWPGMLAGVSTRWYPHALEPVGAAVAA